MNAMPHSVLSTQDCVSITITGRASLSNYDCISHKSKKIMVPSAPLANFSSEEIEQLVGRPSALSTQERRREESPVQEEENLHFRIAANNRSFQLYVIWGNCAVKTCAIVSEIWKAEGNANGDKCRSGPQ